jgi:hypothetical protein
MHWLPDFLRNGQVHEQPCQLKNGRPLLMLYSMEQVWVLIPENVKLGGATTSNLPGRVRKTILLRLPFFPYQQI